MLVSMLSNASAGPRQLRKAATEMRPRFRLEHFFEAAACAFASALNPISVFDGLLQEVGVRPPASFRRLRLKRLRLQHQLACLRTGLAAGFITDGATG